MAGLEVYLELSDRRVFACAYDWPGWLRSGKTEEAALEALLASAPRYARVARAAGVKFDLDPARGAAVIERLPGDATTAFGAPSQLSSRDLAEPSDKKRDRILALLVGSWKIFDEVVAASPEELRKGPRGGGRDRSQIVAHVLSAEAAYSRLIGAQLPEIDPDDARALAAHRRALLDALKGADAVRRAETGKRRWPMRYAVRRIAWHVLDHAWEIEDRQVR